MSDTTELDTNEASSLSSSSLHSGIIARSGILGSKRTIAVVPTNLWAIDNHPEARACCARRRAGEAAPLKHQVSRTSFLCSASYAPPPCCRARATPYSAQLSMPSDRPCSPRNNLKRITRGWSIDSGKPLPCHLIRYALMYSMRSSTPGKVVRAF